MSGSDGGLFVSKKAEKTVHIVVVISNRNMSRPALRPSMRDKKWIGQDNENSITV